ncbi:MAG: dienelactone hydrolase family protein [Acidobacteria bacterium]|nr:dienelactone hydrolase family protein [Acidobacteriota bacterium]
MRRAAPRVQAEGGHRAGRALLGLATLCLIILAPSCEKETHRAARKSFQSILAADLAADDRAAALEAFVRDYPERKTNPHLTRACSLLADHHARAGRADIAASWYERAIRADPADPDLLNALGYHYARNRMNLDRAVAVLEQAVRLAEERQYPARRQGFIKDSLGWAYRMRGDLPLSVALLEEAARLAPGVPIIREHLADAYHAIGERDRAVSVYLDLYLSGRATSAALRETIRAIGREGGPAYARDVDLRMEEGMRGLAESDRRDARSAGATLVTLSSADGHRLAGSLFRPREEERRAAGAARAPAGGILLLHPLGSSRAACTPQAAALVARGFVVLSLDLRGHGGSVNEALPDARAFSARLDENLDASDRDVMAALAFLARQPRVDASRIGVVGAGLGALLAARAVRDPGTDLPGVKASPRPQALVLLSPWGRSEAYRDLLAALDPRSVLLVAGSEEGAALATVKALAGRERSTGPRSLVVDGPGTHYDLAVRLPGLTGTIAGFLTERLGPGERAGG